MSALIEGWPHGYVIQCGEHKPAKARVLAWDLPGQRSIAAVVDTEDGAITRFKASGCGGYINGHEATLRNAPAPKRSGTVWVNINGVAWITREAADRCHRKDRLACIEVPWTEGDGL